MTSTFFASASRAKAESIRSAREAFLENEVAVALLEAVPGFAVVLNPERQIIAANRRFLTILGMSDIEAVIGLRPGEVVECQYACEGPGGCGTGPFCMHCGAVDAIEECLRTQEPISRECRILTRSETDGGAMDLDVQATFIRVSGQNLMVLAMRDISSEKRRQMLERIFFHDVLNTATGIKAATDLLISEEVAHTHDQVKAILGRLSQQMVEEISAQQQLAAAEQGELRLEITEIAVGDLLRGIHAAYCHYDSPTPCPVQLAEIPDCRITTDTVILRRILVNLVKNAVEAVPSGPVTLSAVCNESTVTFSVHNPGVMSEPVQRQVFQRSFSTKSGRGRGIGTYSVKLFTERYLGGKAGFTSTQADGTTFFVCLPA